MSVDIETKEPFTASIERSDSCAVPAASVVAENVVAWELARALVDQFYADRFDKMKAQKLMSIANMRGNFNGIIKVKDQFKNLSGLYWRRGYSFN